MLNKVLWEILHPNINVFYIRYTFHIMLNKVLWEILHPNINVFYIRKMIKALEIKRCNEANMSIMNGGWIGGTLTIE